MDIVKISEKDNVAVAIRKISEGEAIADNVTALERIPAGHKVALERIPSGAAVIKYGYSIGYACADILAGQWVHTHNIKTGLGKILEYTYEPDTLNNGQTLHRNDSKETFMGYCRTDGSVGIRNEIWIIPTVGCVNNVAQALADIASKNVYGTVDRVVAFTHPYGCSQLGEDQENTRKILADLVNHPNAGGVLVLGLGCENSNIYELKRYIGECDSERVKFLVCQECENELAEGKKLLDELINHAASFYRQAVSISKLIVGLKCGGSDGLSGITANPVVGVFSDILTQKEATAILTEVPEMFGAETLLMNRCVNRDVFERTVELINDFKKYFSSYNQTIYENPSPGNKEGGISTLEDKSLGCTQKSGSSSVKGVLQYGERVCSKGLNLLSAPGNDLVAATALAASGAQIVLFTTGRGTPFASPVPTLKISSNSDLANKKQSWIDFDAGRLVEGTDLEELGRELYQQVIRVAEGEFVRSEAAGYHDMAIFKQGVTL